MQAFDRTERIRVPIGHWRTAWDHESTPCPRHKVERGVVHVRMALLLELYEEPHSRQEGLSGLGALKGHGVQERG